MKADKKIAAGSSKTKRAAFDQRGDGPAKRYASSIDVARMAGVSQSAVSRTFSGGARVSEAMRQKVLACSQAT